MLDHDRSALALLDRSAVRSSCDAAAALERWLDAAGGRLAGREAMIL